MTDLQSTIENIKEASITEFIIYLESQEVKLSNSTNGKSKACCPFHEEATPSFTVYEKSGTYKCYGCGDFHKFVGRMYTAQCFRETKVLLGTHRLFIHYFFWFTLLGSSTGERRLDTLPFLTTSM